MKHQKRLSAPKHYPIERKNGKYVVSGKGPHSEGLGVPMTVFLRDIMGFAETADEARSILKSRNVKVNGKVVTRENYTVGFMDSISIEKIDKDFRVLVDSKGLVFKEVEDADKRIYRVEDKTTLKGGETQFNLDGGVNMVLDEEYPTRASLIVDLENDKVEKELPFEEGMTVVVTGGKHIGQIASIKEIHELPGSQTNKVILENQEGVEFETVIDYVFVLGEDEPEVAV